MAIQRFVGQGPVVLVALCSMATLAMTTPQIDGAVGGGGGALQSDLQEISGSALGTILMPTTTELGILVAVGQTADDRVFMLDAQMTSAIPGLFDEHTRVAFGGVYGRLFEAPFGGDGKQVPFDGVVEGFWRMEKSLVGSYEALVYERDGENGLQLVGRIQGAFRVAADNLDVPYGDDVVWVRDEKQRDERFGEAIASKATAGDAAGGSGYGVAVTTKPTAPTYSGATKLLFKLVD